MRDQAQFAEIFPATRSRPASGLAPGVRLPQFIKGPQDACAKLRGLRVIVVGTGSVGARAAFHLARMGVAELWLVDGKNFKAESLLTHEIGPEDVGKSKATVIGHRCKAISPTTHVHVFMGRVQELPMDAFAVADLVLIATDNLAAELEVSRRCRQLGKPLIHAAVHGESLTVQIRCFSNAREDSPCVGCGFTQEEWKRLAQQAQFSCNGSAPFATPVSDFLTLSASSLCSLAADLALNQVLRLVLTLGGPVTDTMVEFCGYTNLAVTSPLVCNTSCPCDHRRYELASAPKRLRDASLAELAKAAGFRDSVGVMTFTLEGFEWARLGQCECPVPRAVDRFIASGQADAGRCGNCRSPLRVTPFFRDRTVSSWTLRNAAEASLEALGAPGVGCVLADNGNHAVIFREAKNSSKGSL